MFPLIIFTIFVLNIVLQQNTICVNGFIVDGDCRGLYIYGLDKRCYQDDTMIHHKDCKKHVPTTFDPNYVNNMTYQWFNQYYVMAREGVSKCDCTYQYNDKKHVGFTINNQKYGVLAGSYCTENHLTLPDYKNKGYEYGRVGHLKTNNNLEQNVEITVGLYSYGFALPLLSHLFTMQTADLFLYIATDDQHVTLDIQSGIVWDGSREALYCSSGLVKITFNPKSLYKSLLSVDTNLSSNEYYRNIAINVKQNVIASCVGQIETLTSGSEIETSSQYMTSCGDYESHTDNENTVGKIFKDVIKVFNEVATIIGLFPEIVSNDQIIIKNKF